MAIELLLAAMLAVSAGAQTSQDLRQERLEVEPVSAMGTEDDLEGLERNFGLYLKGYAYTHDEARARDILTGSVWSCGDESRAYVFQPRANGINRRWLGRGALRKEFRSFIWTEARGYVAERRDENGAVLETETIFPTRARRNSPWLLAIGRTSRLSGNLSLEFCQSLPEK